MRDINMIKDLILKAQEEVRRIVTCIEVVEGLIEKGVAVLEYKVESKYLTTFVIAYFDINYFIQMVSDSDDDTDSTTYTFDECEYVDGQVKIENPRYFKRDVVEGDFNRMITLYENRNNFKDEIVIKVHIDYNGEIMCTKYQETNTLIFPGAI